LLQSRKIPKSASIIEAKIPTLNNTYDVLSLKKSDGTMLDTIYYNMSWGHKGISLERKDCLKAAVSSDNWKISESSDSATAGKINSITQVVNDLSVSSILVNKSNELEILIQNTGKKMVENGIVMLFIDKNADSLFSNIEIMYQQDLPNLDSGQFFTIKFNSDAVKKFSGKTSGLLCLVTVSSQSDQRSENDSLIQRISFSLPQGTILINEFLYDPISGCGEFLELYNSCDEIISLNNWILHDRPVNNNYDSILISLDFCIQPSCYSVLCWDSSFFYCYPQLQGSSNVYYKKSILNFNISADDIVLLDGNGNLMNSLSYSGNWHSKATISSKGKSLEKISPEIESNKLTSWTTCIDMSGATPCRANSVMKQIKYNGGLSAEPNPFSPFANNKHPFCVISYQLPFKESYLTAKIFDLNGVLIRELSNGEVVNNKGNLIWDGRNDKEYTMQVGGYVLMVEAKDVSSDNVHQEKLLLVIGQ
jgi:hypothetical protein